MPAPSGRLELSDGITVEASPRRRAAAYREGSAMKLLFACVLAVLLSGCIPIGIQGKTLAIAAPGSVAAARLPGADRAADPVSVSA